MEVWPAMDVFSVTIKAELQSAFPYETVWSKFQKASLSTNKNFPCKANTKSTCLPNYLLVFILVRKRKPHQSEDIIL